MGLHDALIHVSQVLQLIQVLHVLVGEERTDLRKRPWLQKRKHRSPQLDPVSALVWGDDVKVNVDVGLECQQIRHSQRPEYTAVVCSTSKAL